ncbi:MAG TPA: hypothetical protein VFO31_00350 [Vicinamibacterales bacterium]|nr:hypothetical protein [Vicinamibacterales bacterium]
MADFNVRSDAVDVDEIMKQIRGRIREKRGVDYTEADLQHLANIKMEQFLDPRKLRSDLVEQFKRQRAASPAPHSQEGAPPVETGNVFKRLFRKMARRIVRAAINPQDMVDAMHAEFRRREELYYEILHNLVVELTRLGIEVHNLRMHVESMSSRLDFDERRGRALEGVVQYRTTSLTGGSTANPPIAAAPPPTASAAGGPGAPIASVSPSGTPGGSSATQQNGSRPDGERRRRRRRRRRRHGAGGPGGPGTPGAPGAPGTGAAPETSGQADGDAGDFEDAGDGNGDGAPDQ